MTLMLIVLPLDLYPHPPHISPGLLEQILVLSEPVFHWWDLSFRLSRLIIPKIQYVCA